MSAPPINEITAPVGQIALMGLEVLNWRFEQLERAGYPTDIAVLLAERGDVDLHEACELLVGGATIHLALSILT
jgi:hypothetical protein